MRTLLAFALGLVLLAAPNAFAQENFTFQGLLTDASGQPVADGTYTLNLRVYTSLVGGTLVYESSQSVTTSGGVYSIDFLNGSVLTDNLDSFTDATYWIEQVVNGTALAPRVRVTGAPFADRAKNLALPVVDTDNSAIGVPLASMDISTNLFFDADAIRGRAGSGAGVNGIGRWGVYGVGSDIGVYGASSETTGFDYGIFGTTASLDGYAGFFDKRVGIEGGTGDLFRPMLNVSSSDSDGLVVETNQFSTYALTARTNDAQSRAVFGMANDSTSYAGYFSGRLFVGGSTGVDDNDVQLPTASVNQTEIFGEVGVASATDPFTNSLTTTVSSVLSRTISAPTDGYVLALGSGRVCISHVTGTTSNTVAGISTSSTVIPTAQDLDFQVPSNAPSGSYCVPITPQGIFQVSAGSNTFYFVGRETGGNSTLADLNLTLVFLPTTYGIATSNIVGDESDEATVRQPQSASEIAAEQAASLRYVAEQQQAELDAMRAQLDALQAEVRARRGSEAEREAELEAERAEREQMRQRRAERQAEIDAHHRATDAARSSAPQERAPQPSRQGGSRR
ncbi:MAG: hypothetical protein AAGF99_11740 [Bacteroidota bacterium]